MHLANQNFLRESCKQLLMVCDHSSFPTRSPHNAGKSKGGETVVQILDFKEALWLQLTRASIHSMRIVMPM